MILFYCKNSRIIFLISRQAQALTGSGGFWVAKMRKEDTVKLISAQGFEFVVHKDAAMVSQTIRNMLTSLGSFAETQHGEVTFSEITTTILEKICKYFYWNLQFAGIVEDEIVA